MVSTTKIIHKKISSTTTFNTEDWRNSGIKYVLMHIKIEKLLF